MGNEFSAAISGGGTLDLAAGSSSTFTPGGATSATLTVASVSLEGAATIDQNLAYAGNLTGASASSLTINNGDTLTLSGTNSLSGATNGSGTLAVTGGTTTLNSGATATVLNLAVSGSGTVLAVAGDLSYAGSLTEDAGAAINIGSGDTLTLSGTASLSGSVGGAGGALAVTDGTTTFSSSADASGLDDLSVSSSGTVAVDQLSLYGTVSNSGAINVAAGGSLYLGGAISGTGGQINLGAGSSLELDGSITNGETISFGNAAGIKVNIGSASTFGAAVTGFTSGDTLDLEGEIVKGLSYSGSTLKVTLNDGTTQSFNVKGSFAGLAATSDGGGGTDIVAGPSLSIDGGTAGVTENSAQAGSVHFTIAGLDPSATNGAVTFTDSANNQATATFSGNGTFQADLHALNDGPITSAVSYQEGGASFIGTPGNVVALDTDVSQTASLAVTAPTNGAGASAVSFSVTGLDDTGTGTVTFRDANNKTVIVNVTGSGTAVANLSGLADGPISSALSFTDASGNQASATGNAVSIDPDFGQTAGLAVTAPTNGPGASAVSFSVTGLDDTGSGTVTFRDVNNKTVGRQRDRQRHRGHQPVGPCRRADQFGPVLHGCFGQSGHCDRQCRQHRSGLRADREPCGDGADQRCGRLGGLVLGDGPRRHGQRHGDLQGRQQQDRGGQRDRQRHRGRQPVRSCRRADQFGAVLHGCFGQSGQCDRQFGQHRSGLRANRQPCGDGAHRWDGCKIGLLLRDGPRRHRHRHGDLHGRQQRQRGGQHHRGWHRLGKSVWVLPTGRSVRHCPSRICRGTRPAPQAVT